MQQGKEGERDKGEGGGVGGEAGEGTVLHGIGFTDVQYNLSITALTADRFSQCRGSLHHGQ